VIGGTKFVGRHLVETALGANHEVTLFNRGKTNPDLFTDTESLRGDRSKDLSALVEREWDVVIDTCGYLPADVRRSAEQLAGSTDLYVFISTQSVYPDMTAPVVDEESAVATTDDPDAEAVDDANYGALKALCEKAAEDAMPGRCLHVRAGLIVGPHDDTDRFTYWPVRIAGGGSVLTPGDPARLVQFIDARDLADWTVTMAERRTPGVFNVTGPPSAFGDVLEHCKGAAGSDARFVWAADEWLASEGVDPWIELPLWIPEEDGRRPDMVVDCSRATSAGLATRSVVETAADTLAWDRTRGSGPRGAGMSPDRESELLRKLREKEAGNL
jgi:2'-hydroxyisoflavone reductase